MKVICCQKMEFLTIWKVKNQKKMGTLSRGITKVMKKMAERIQKEEVSWTKVAGASGYVIYRNGSAAKTVKSSVSTWKDTKAYDSQTGMYWVYNYYVRAFKTVNGKRIYSKPTKTINLYS